MKWKEVRETIAWVFGIIGAIIVIYSFATRPSVDLSAEVRYDAIKWPSSWRQSLKTEILPIVGPLSSIKGTWNVTVKNGKDQEVESVEILLPNAIMVQTKREGLPATLDSIGGLLSLGRMRPGEVISVIAWTDTEPSNEMADDIWITHKGGTGKVLVFQRVTSVEEFLHHHSSFFLLFSLTMIAISLTVMTLSLRAMYSSIRKEASTESNKQEP